MPDVSLNGIEFVIKGGADDATASVIVLTNALKNMSAALHQNSSVSKLSVGIKSVGSAAKKATSHIGAFLASIKRIAMYRMIRGIIKSVTEAMQEGAQAFYDFTKRVNPEFTNYAKALDGVKNSTGIMKAQLGAAWGSLYAAIAPIIQSLVSLVIKFANALTMIFARLSGATGWYKATKAIDDTSKSIKGAGKAAKEAMKYLAPFDELNRLPDNNQSGGGGGGGSDTFSANYEWVSFEKLNLSEILKKVVEFLKDSFTKIAEWFEGIDWKALGKKLYDGLKKTLKKIDWKGLSKAFWRMLGAALGAASALVVGFVGEAWKDIKKYFKRFIDADGDGKWCGKDILLGILKGVWNAIKSGVQFFRDYILIPFVNGFRKAFGIASPAKEMNEPGRMVALGILEGIAKPFKDIYAWVTTNVKTPLLNALKQLESVTPNLKGFKALWDGIDSKKVTLTAILAGAAIKTFEALKKVWDGIVTKPATLTANLVKNFTDSALAAIQTAWSKIQSVKATFTAALSANSTVKAFVNSWNSLTDKFLNLKVSISDSIKNAWNTAAKAWNKNSITSALGKLPLLAKGGIVDGATFIGNAIVGEAGKEAVIPLEQNTEWIDTVASGMIDRLGGEANIIDYAKLTNAIYSGMARALADNPDDRDIYLDGEVVYRKMVQRNRRETFVRGANPMMA